MLESHEEKVRRVAERVRARAPGRPLTIGKAHPGHTPHDLGYKNNCHAVDVDALDAILAIDRDARTATVEGQVRLGPLCRQTLAHGLVPKVVPEFETFTISGLINGLGIETSSHRHSVFPTNVAALEVVLGNGDVVEADRSQRRDLMTQLPGSYGTLGIVTRATLELAEAKPFVRSRYRRFSRRADYVRAFAAALDEHAFVEGFVLAPDHYVLVSSDFSDRVASLDTFAAMAPGNRWYYQHAADQARSDGEDLVPTYEYFFRHQRSLLWMSGVFADLKLFSETRRGRAFLDRQVEARVRTSGFKGNIPAELVERCLVHQDMGMLLERLDEGIAYVQEHLGVYPLWNCPAGPVSLDGATGDAPFTIPRRLVGRRDMMVDIGIYGEPTVRDYRPFTAMPALQRFVDVPSLWGVCYLSPDELAQVYDFSSYEAARRRYRADDAFLSLTSKIHFMRPSASDKGRVRLWRLYNLWYDLKARWRSIASAPRPRSRERERDTRPAAAP
jgi:FAD/FMN-containing dehydrogenase